MIHHADISKHKMGLSQVSDTGSLEPLVKFWILQKLLILHNGGKFHVRQG